MNPNDERIIDRIGVLSRGSGRTTSEVFADVVELTYYGIRSVRGILIGDAEDSRDLPAETARIHELYGPDLRHFYDIIIEVGEAGTDEARPTFRDTLGTIYEELGLGSVERGQFLTGESTANLISESIRPDAASEVRRRIGRAIGGKTGQSIEDDRDLDSLLLYSVWRTEGSPPIEPVRHYDPAAGTGRLLLSAAASLPLWMVRENLVSFYGQEVDRLLWRICQVNMTLYGLNGAGIRIIDRSPADA